MQHRCAVLRVLSALQGPTLASSQRLGLGSPLKQPASMRKEAVEAAVNRTIGCWCITESTLPTAAPVPPAMCEQQREQALNMSRGQCLAAVRCWCSAAAAITGMPASPATVSLLIIRSSQPATSLQRVLPQRKPIAGAQKPTATPKACVRLSVGLNTFVICCVQSLSGMGLCCSPREVIGHLEVYMQVVNDRQGVNVALTCQGHRHELQVCCSAELGPQQQAAMPSCEDPLHQPVAGSLAVTLKRLKMMTAM